MVSSPLCYVRKIDPSKVSPVSCLASDVDFTATRLYINIIDITCISLIPIATKFGRMFDQHVLVLASKYDEIPIFRSKDDRL